MIATNDVPVDLDASRVLAAVSARIRAFSDFKGAPRDPHPFGWAGPQGRVVEHWLYADGVPQGNRFSSSHGSAELGAGIGRDWRHLRVDAAGWARVTADLPVTVGIQLDAWW